MKPVKARIPKALPRGAYVDCADNSGAKVLYIVSVKGAKTVKRRYPAAGVGDYVVCSVRKGSPETRKTLVPAVIVRQKKEYRRPDGTRIKFEDNAAVVLKEDKSNTPRGTIIKGPVAREAADRWPGIAKIASIIV